MRSNLKNVFLACEDIDYFMIARRLFLEIVILFLQAAAHIWLAAVPA